MGTSRLMVLLDAADCKLYVSKTVSIFNTDQTWLPFSGRTVNRISSSVSRHQAIGPKEESEAQNSGFLLDQDSVRRRRCTILAKVLTFRIWLLNLMLDHAHGLINIQRSCRQKRSFVFFTLTYAPRSQHAYHDVSVNKKDRDETHSGSSQAVQFRELRTLLFVFQRVIL